MSTAMREAFGKHMAEIGKDHPEMIVLDADVSSSTKSALFGKAFPRDSSMSELQKATWQESQQDLLQPDTIL